MGDERREREKERERERKRERKIDTSLYFSELKIVRTNRLCEIS